MQKFALIIVLTTLTLFAAGQSNTDINQMLSKPETRKQVIDRIANDSTMANEMMNAMMNGKSHKMMMMEACKSDTGMMKSMNKTIMGNPQMKDSMDKRMKESQDSKAVEGLDKTKLTLMKKDR